MGRLVFFVVKVEKGQLVAPTYNLRLAGTTPHSLLFWGSEGGSDFLVSARLDRFPTNRVGHRPGAPLLPHSPEISVAFHLPG